MQTAMDRLGSKLTEAVRDSLGNNAENLSKQSANLMSAALTDELQKLQSVINDMGDEFKSEFMGANHELQQTIGKFEDVLGNVASTVKDSSQITQQSAERLVAHEAVVKSLDVGSSRLRDAAEDLLSLKETFVDASKKNKDAAIAQEKAAEKNEKVAEQFEIVAENLPKVQQSIIDGSSLINELKEPISHLALLLEKSPETFEGQLSSTIEGFDSVIIRSAKKSSNKQRACKENQHY